MIGGALEPSLSSVISSQTCSLCTKCHQICEIRGIGNSLQDIGDHSLIVRGGTLAGGRAVTLLKESGSSYSGGKGNLLPCSRFTPRVKTRRPLRPEVVSNGSIDPKSTKADADETLKENQAAEEAALQAQVTKAQAAAEALGDVPAFAKQAADLRHVWRKRLRVAKRPGKVFWLIVWSKKSRFVERETKRLEPSRKDWETVHDELAVREAALAEDVATSKTQMMWWRGTLALELPWTLTLDLMKRQDSRRCRENGSWH